MADTESSDRDLVARVRAGEDRAFAELIRRHHGRIAGLCASMIGASGADDAAQEVFLKAYQSLSKFKGDCAFSTWLYRVASNHCLDLLRKRARERSDSLEAILEGEGGAAFERLLAEPDAQRKTEDADLIERLLRTLPPDYRLILTLREVQGLSYEEIMDAMDCSMDSVKARLRRARESLEEAARHISGTRGV